MRYSRTLRTWGLLLLAILSFAWPLGTAGLAANYQRQTILPCVQNLQNPRMYSISIAPSEGSPVPSEAWEQYLVAVPSKANCDQKSLEGANLITIKNGRCRILTAPERQKLAQRLFRHRYQDFSPVQNNDYRSAAADLVNRWEQDRRADNQDYEPLVLAIEDAWIFAELKFSLPDYVPVRIKGCQISHL
jgi:hypothetical protein